jgi:hypothetical protein
MIRRTFAYNQNEGGGAGGTPAGTAATAGGTPAGDKGDKGDKGEQYVPRERLADETKKRRDAEKRATEAEARAGDAEKAQQKADKLAAELASERELRSLARAGVVDDDHVDALRIAWLKTPEADRAKTLVDFAEAMRDATDRPKILTGFYGTSVAGERQVAPPPKTPGQRRDPPAEAPAWAVEMTRLTSELAADPNNAAKRKAFQEHKAKRP